MLINLLGLSRLKLGLLLCEGSFLLLIWIMMTWRHWHSVIDISRVYLFDIDYYISYYLLFCQGSDCESLGKFCSFYYLVCMKFNKHPCWINHPRVKVEKCNEHLWQLFHQSGLQIIFQNLSDMMSRKKNSVRYLCKHVRHKLL